MMAMGSLKGGEYMFTVVVPDLPRSVRIREVGPRDGFQNEPEVIATDDKVRLIDALMRTGLRRIEATSFVRADVIPQLADADEVLARIDRPEDVSVSVLIPNERGLQNALVNHGRFQEINVFLSASETHNRKNVNRSIRESLLGLERVLGHAREEGLRCEAVISVAFGCPYEGHVAPERVLDIAGRLVRAGAQEVGFGDTTGMANPLQVRAFFEQARTVLGDDVELTAHFHNTRGQGLANVLAALEVGIDSFESSFGELGGCPVPAGATGNIATEDLVSMLHEMGVETGIDLEALLEAARAARDVLGRPLGQPHPRGRSGRLAGGIMSRIDELLEQARARLTRVDPAAARAAIDAGAVLVDIRAESQRRRDGVVPGSVFIARNVLEWRCDPDGSHRDERVADPERPLIVMCDAGFQSSLAAATLHELGHDRATDLDGGFQAWRAAGLPVEPLEPDAG